MKVAFINPFQLRFPRGIERYVWELANQFAGPPYSVETHVLTRNQPNPVDWGTSPANLRIRRVPYFRYYGKYLAIPFYLYWLARERYDWVFLSFASYGEAEALALLRRIRQQRYCIVFHFPHDLVPHRYKEFTRRGIAARADRLVAVSHHVAEGVSDYYQRECAVIGNGVDPEVFRPSDKTRTMIREQMGVSGQGPILVTLAALEERKGVQWIIRAIPHLLGEFPDLQFWVLGEGSYRSALEDMIRQHDLSAQVRLLGSQADVIPYLTAADMGCLLSYGEAFPITLLEYMATQLPIVASRHPPFPELIQPDAGLMVDEKDSHAVADAIRSLWRDPEKVSRMGLAGRARILQNHTWEIVARQYMALMDSS